MPSECGLEQIFRYEKNKCDVVPAFIMTIVFMMACREIDGAIISYHCVSSCVDSV